MIRGLHIADCDPSKLGFAITVFGHGQPSEARLRRLTHPTRIRGTHARAYREVRECHMLNVRKSTSILKIVSKDLRPFRKFLDRKLTPAQMSKSVNKTLADDPNRTSRSGRPAFERGKGRGDE